MSDNRRRARAVADRVSSVDGGLPKHLRTERFLRILQIEFLGDRDAVVADQWYAPLLLDQNRLGLRPQRDPHGVGELGCAAQDLLPGGGVEQNVFVRHRVFLPSNHMGPGVASGMTERLCKTVRWAMFARRGSAAHSVFHVFVARCRGTRIPV